MTFNPLYFLLTIVFVIKGILGADASEQKDRLLLPTENSIYIALGNKTNVDGPQPDSKASDKTLIHCTAPRPKVCTMDYKPVCAQLKDGSFKTYSNGCSA